MSVKHLFLGACLACALLGCSHSRKGESPEVVLQIDSGVFLIEFDHALYSRVTRSFASETPSLMDFTASEYAVVGDETVKTFQYTSDEVRAIDDKLGSGKAYIIKGLATNGLEKTVTVKTYDNLPSAAVYSVEYSNLSQGNMRLEKWVNHAYLLNQKTKADTDVPYFWSFQAESSEARSDWILPLEPGFEQDNYMGMNNADYGGGTPISDVWRDDVGLAVGHIELTPKLVSLPVVFDPANKGVEVGVELEYVTLLKPGESKSTFSTFLNMHQGDFYQTLKTYREMMARQGLKAPDFPDSSYEPVWCAWGYERDFHLDDILATLPKAKELGFEWAVLDDGWQTAEGDWHLHPEKFPNGDADMTAFVDKIKAHGLKAKLWWAPLAVDPGTDLLHEHSDMLLLDENGAVHDVSWWNSFYLCPAYDKTVDMSVELVKKIMNTWGYSGLKIDGHHLNSVPPCYNKKHNHAYPEESVEKLQDFWKKIYETAQEIDPNSVIEICPCGDSYAFHNMPYMNQPVSSDPSPEGMGSGQIRQKGKTLKGLMGESTPYYGDHVELSSNADDFASSVGVGAVVGSKFTWPAGGKTGSGFLLTEEKEREWKKWVGIYSDKMLSKGEYLGELYDIGFDLPEAHAIAKDGKLYYAFYADKWQGEVELRGLTEQKYQLRDYENNLDYPQVSGERARIEVEFNHHLLLEAIPLDE